MGLSSSEKTTEALKIAKRHLKKQDSGSIKIKKLSKEVVKKLECPVTSAKDVKEWISTSKKFTVEGKHVSLSKNRVAGNKRGNDESIKVDGDGKKPKLNSTHNDNESVADWRSRMNVIVKDTGDDGEELEVVEEYFPYMSFDSPQLMKQVPRVLLEQCTEGNGFREPTPIQSQCWPILLNTVDGKRRDLVGLAMTGSGKTLAFAIPALAAMHSGKSKGGRPRMLVLAPTRELAMQSHEVLLEFGATLGLKSLVLYGGVPKQDQRKELRNGTDCIVATPGRLQDMIEEGCCDLSDVCHLVLDEADRMIDVGFEETVRFIISQCKSKDSRQTAMWSATWPTSIQKIALQYMNNPVRVYVGFSTIGDGSNGDDAVDESLAANKQVSQTVEVLEDRARESRLRELLGQYHKTRENRVLVFVLYKREAERVELALRRDGWNCCSIHGNKNQAARTAALSQFKDGTCPLMVATDVAARGLDIPNVEVVINYSFPLTIEDYVHRIGRTGRAGKKGISHTFFQSSDKARAGELQNVMRQAGQEVPEELTKFGSTIKKKEHSLYGSFGPRDNGASVKKATKIRFD